MEHWTLSVQLSVKDSTKQHRLFEALAVLILFPDAQRLFLQEKGSWIPVYVDGLLMRRRSSVLVVGYRNARIG